MEIPSNLNNLESSHIKLKFVYLITITLVALLAYTSIRLNDYRVKELVDVVDAEEIVEVFNRKSPLDDAALFNRSVSKPESIQELIEFLHQYKVKK